MNVTIAVVSYNVAPLLSRCLQTAADNLAEIGGHGQIVVVDNASTDGSADLVRSQVAQVRLFANSTNVGFGVACNQVLAVAHTDGAILFLNPDAELRPGALKALLDGINNSPNAALVGPHVTYPDGRPQPTRRRFPSLLTLGLESTPLEWRGAAAPLLRRYRYVDEPEREGPVEWLSGACLLGRVSALRAVGGFDPTFFMYFEETDLARRLAAYGWQTRYEPAAEIVHAHSQSADQDLSAKDRHYYGSKYRYAARYFGTAAMHAIRLFSAGLFATEAALQRRRGAIDNVTRYAALARWHLSGTR